MVFNLNFVVLILKRTGYSFNGFCNNQKTIYHFCMYINTYYIFIDLLVLLYLNKVSILNARNIIKKENYWSKLYLLYAFSIRMVKFAINTTFFVFQDYIYIWSPF